MAFELNHQLQDEDSGIHHWGVGWRMLHEDKLYYESDQRLYHQNKTGDSNGILQDVRVKIELTLREERKKKLMVRDPQLECLSVRHLIVVYLVVI